MAESHSNNKTRWPPALHICGNVITRVNVSKGKGKRVHMTHQEEKR